VSRPIIQHPKPVQAAVLKFMQSDILLDLFMSVVIMIYCTYTSIIKTFDLTFCDRVLSVA